MSDQPEHTDHPSTNDTDWVDDLGRRAGAAIRTPASAADLQRLRQRHARRRTTTAIATGTAVLALTAGALALTLVDRDGSRPQPHPITTTPTTDAPTTTAISSTTAPLPPSTIEATSTSVADVSPTALEDISRFPTDDLVKPTWVFSSADFDVGTTRIRFLPDGESFLIGDTYGIANGRPAAIFDTDTGEFVRSFPAAQGDILPSDAPILFNVDASRYFDGFRLWDLTSKEVLVRSNFPMGGFATAAGFSPDGTHLAVATFEGALTMFDATDGRRVWQADIGPFSVRRVRLQFSEDGTAVAVADGVYDAATGELRPDAQVTVSAPIGGFWDPAEVAALGGPYLDCDPVGGTSQPRTNCDITDDGTRIAFITGGTIRIWEVEP